MPRTKPTALKKATGNPGKRPLNKNEPQPALGDAPPPPPDYLTGLAAAEWERLSRQLWLNGILGLEDHAAFAGYCQAWSDWRRYDEMIAKQRARAAREHEAFMAWGGDQPALRHEFDGEVIGTTNGNLIQNPVVGMRNSARRECLKFAAEFGLTPSSRSKVNVPRGAAAAAQAAPTSGPRPTDFLNRGPRLAVSNP